MKIWGDLAAKYGATKGREITDKLFLEMHYLLWNISGFKDAAIAFMQSDANLYNGDHLCTIVRRFKEHGLVDNYVDYSVTNFMNRTVTSSNGNMGPADLWTGSKRITSINGCSINVQNVTIQSGAKLNLNAENETIIDAHFEVQAGAELEIK